MEAFSIKINTEGCLVFSLSVSPPSSVAVLSQFCRWLNVVYRSRCLFLSCLRKIAFSFFFSIFFSVCRIWPLVGSSLCYYIPVSFFSFVFYSFLPSFFLSLCLYFLIVALFLFLVFCSFPSFPPRYRRLSLMKNSRISRVPMKSCCRVKLMEEGWSIGPGAFICRYSASHLARRSSLRLRG